MMTCERTEELLSAYLEGELAPAERAEVEAHLAACPECAELAALVREGMAAAAALPELEPSPQLLARLYDVPGTKKVRKPFFRPVFEWLGRPALQPTGRVPIRVAPAHAAGGAIERLPCRRAALW